MSFDIENYTFGCVGFEPQRGGWERRILSRVGNYSKPWVLKERGTSDRFQFKSGSILIADMKKPTYKLKGRVWLYPGDNAAWHFVTLPKKESKEIEKTFTGILRRGFGSVRVHVTVGKTSWDTSIFPDKKRGAYLLPLKGDVREKEHVVLNKMLSYTLELKDV